jgi:hypothetical protein
MVLQALESYSRAIRAAVFPLDGRTLAWDSEDYIVTL